MRVFSLALICGVMCHGGGAADCPADKRPAPAPAPEPSTASPSTPAPTTSRPDGDAPRDEGLSIEEQAHNVPGPPGSVHVAHQGGLHIVEWKGTRDDTIGGYEVYRECPGETWKRVALVRLREDDPRNRGMYRFEERLDAVCRYTVAAVTPAGQPGPRTIEIQ